MVRKPPRVRDWLVVGTSDHELGAAWWTIVAEKDPSPLAVRKSKWVILAAQRGEISPPLWVRQFIADELQRVWVSTPVQANAATRRVRAAGLQTNIDQLAKEGTLAEAEEKVAADSKFPTVEALKLFLLRNQ